MSGRWKTALHEAGHACAALALGGTCARLAICPDGHGMAFIDGLLPFDHAITLAAGAAAEGALGDEPAPPGPEPQSVHARREAYHPPAEELSSLAARFPRATAVSDERAVAQFSISGLEHEPPERWAQRYYTIHAVASQVVEDHRQQILRLARELFRRGELHEHEISMELARA